MISDEDRLGGWFKGLVGATCAVALAAVAWWGWSEERSAQVRAASSAAQAIADQVQSEIDRQRQLDDCRDDIASWDAGDRAAVSQRYGDSAERIIDECRLLVSIPTD